MQTPVTPEQRQAAKRAMVKQMEQGVSARDARVSSAVPMHRTTVYRLRKRVQREGEQALADGRHGHPVKLRGEALTFLVEHCQATPSVSSPAIQHQIHERFDLCISVSQLNRVRARLGLSHRAVPREKKPKASLSIESGYHEHAGGLLLLAAAHETALLSHLCEALPTEVTATHFPLAGSSAAVRLRLLLILLFLGAVGLYRSWDLRGYMADGLALLTGRKRAYGYRYTEAFLSQVAHAGGADRLTDALAQWTMHLWHASEEASEQPTTGCDTTHLNWSNDANRTSKPPLTPGASMRRT